MPPCAPGSWTGAGAGPPPRAGTPGDWDDKAQAVGIVPTADGKTSALCGSLSPTGSRAWPPHNHHVNAYGRSAPA